MTSITIQVYSNSQQAINSIFEVDSNNREVEESTIQFNVTESGKSFGAFGTEFWASILISIPIGIASGVIASSIYDKICSNNRQNSSVNIIVVVFNSEIDMSSSNAKKEIEQIVGRHIK